MIMSEAVVKIKPCQAASLELWSGGLWLEIIGEADFIHDPFATEL